MGTIRCAIYKGWNDIQDVIWPRFRFPPPNLPDLDFLAYRTKVRQHSTLPLQKV